MNIRRTSSSDAPSSTAWISVRGTIESLTRSERSSNTLDRISDSSSSKSSVPVSRLSRITSSKSRRRNCWNVSLSVPANRASSPLTPPASLMTGQNSQ